MRALLLLFLVQCGADANICWRAKQQLKDCGFPVSALDCSLSDRSLLEGMALKLSERGCEAVAESADSRAVDPRLCALMDWPCPKSPTPELQPRATRFPVVLVSGIDGSPSFDWHPHIAEAIARDTGSKVFHVKVLPWATTRERAADLWQSLQALPASGRLNLFCYAVAGLDCRYLASPRGLLDAAEHSDAIDRIASITTIATPHRGTEVASAIEQLIVDGSAEDLLSAVLGGDSAFDVPDDARILATLRGLTPTALRAFNAEVNNASNVRYASIAGVSRAFGRAAKETRAACEETFEHDDALNEALLPVSLFSHAALDDSGRRTSTPSDGMISVASAKWGRFLGCLPADHYDVIGQIGHTTRDPRTGFDATTYYPWLVSRLAAEGL